LVTVELEQLSFAYGSQTVLSGLDLRLEPMVTAIVGPNAVGKTTLLKCLAGLLRPRGAITLNGQSIRTLNRKKRVEMIGYLAQMAPYGATVVTVLETVLLGRLHTLSWRVGDDDLAIAFGVLYDLGLGELAERPIGELSGGQQRMVSIAQVLAQRPKVLLMDEPTISLDLQHQLETLDLIRQLTRERGLTTVLTLHDLNAAARYADRIVVLHEGRVYAVGEAADVLTPEMLRTVYGVKAKVRIEDDGVPQIVPLRPIQPSGLHARLQ
jgi:iron complex transport system ATP-binding protein